MHWSFKHVLVFAVVVVLAAWYLRYEYITRSIGGVSCVTRIDRFTADRCLLSTEIPACRKVVTLFPCDR